MYIECRYQYWSKDGIAWTKWFKPFLSFANEKDAQSYIDNTLKSQKKNKLKHEYRINYENNN